MVSRRIPALLGAAVLGVITLAVPATAAAHGAPVRGTMAGSGATTLECCGGTPILHSDSDGTLAARILGRGTYHLSVTTGGLSRAAELTVSTRRGTLVAGASFPGGVLSGTPLTVTSGTGRFAHASGTLTLTGYTQTIISCLMVPICTYDESATLEGAIRLRGARR